MLQRLAAAKASAQEPESEVSWLRKGNRGAASLTGVVARLQESFPTFANSATPICHLCKVQAMLTGLSYILRSATMLLYICYLTLSVKRVKSPSVSSQVRRGVLVIIQVWLILQGNSFQHVPCVRRASDCSYLK